MLPAFSKGCLFMGVCLMTYMLPTFWVWSNFILT